ncbi:hypothetical protein ARMSODRAFT_40550 [Armillaria solidipes]|uniref:Uncharacterized protein n=1 Tax=Armillaria solidipes TaxID=1076256 RepID=A0A2H3CSZ9_9AGAR|nr:hypothetical protein ARMSODRAFT_40550 [Armillaria solidipes]
MHEPFACIPSKFHFPPIHVRIFLFQPEESRRTCQWPVPWLPRLSLTGRVCDHKSDFQSVLLSLLMPLFIISTYSYRIPTIYRVCVL